MRQIESEEVIRDIHDFLGVKPEVTETVSVEFTPGSVRMIGMVLRGEQRRYWTTISQGGTSTQLDEAVQALRDDSLLSQAVADFLPHAPQAHRMQLVGLREGIRMNVTTTPDRLTYTSELLERTIKSGVGKLQELKRTRGAGIGFEDTKLLVGLHAAKGAYQEVLGARATLK